MNTTIFDVNPYFEKNLGQLPDYIKYKMKTNDYIVYFIEDKLIISLPSYIKNNRNVFYMKFENTNRNAEIKGQDKQVGVVNYLIGNDESKWINNIPTYSKIKYKELYNNMDIYYYINDRNLEYDFILSKGANPNDISINFEGVDDLEINEDENIILTIGDIKAIFLKPDVYQIIDNEKVNVYCKYLLDKNKQIHFLLSEYEEEYELVLDPILKLDYSTYIGGPKCDFATGIAVDNEGCAYITGYTEGGYPTTTGQMNFGGSYMDAFVTKLNQDGSGLIYSTYIGGNNGDFSNGIAIDSGGYVYITGVTYSSDFPVSSDSYQKTYGGNGDVFVSKFNTSGQILLYSTYIGGNKLCIGNSITVDSLGCVYITGQTEENYPTTEGAYQTKFLGEMDAFVSKIDINRKKIIYSTYLGGSGKNCGNKIVLDKDEYVYVTGYAGDNYPTTKGAYQTRYGGGYSDIFISKMSKDGSSLIYSTYIGGTSEDCGSGITIDDEGNAYIVGYTKGDYPVINSYKSNYTGSRDMVISKINKYGTELIYSTYIGGSGSEHAYEIALNDEGAAYIVGYEAGNLFILKLSSDGHEQLKHIVLSNGTDEYGRGIAIDSNGNIYIAGYAQRNYQTTTGAYQTQNNGLHDAVVSKLIPADVDIVLGCNPEKIKLLNMVKINLKIKNKSKTSIDINIKYQPIDSSMSFVSNSLFIQSVGRISDTIPEEIYISNIEKQKTAQVELDLKYIYEKFPNQIPVTVIVEVYDNSASTAVLVDSITKTLYIDTTIGPTYIPGCNNNLYNLEIDGELQIDDSGIPIVYYKSENSYVYMEPNEDKYIYKILSDIDYVIEHKII